MAACDICEISDYPGGCTEISQEQWEIWAACEYESVVEYKEFVSSYNARPPHKR